MKCRRGDGGAGRVVLERAAVGWVDRGIRNDQMFCGSCEQIIPLGHTACPLCGVTLLDQACIGCGGSWQMARLDGDLAGYCTTCDWYITSSGLFRLQS